MTRDMGIMTFHTWMCVCCAIIACTLKWGVALVGVIFYWALFTSSWDPLSDTGPMQASDQHMGPHAG